MLEKLLTGTNSQGDSSVNSPKSSYAPYLIGGDIALIVLAVVLVSYRFIRKTKNLK